MYDNFRGPREKYCNHSAFGNIIRSSSFSPSTDSNEWFLLISRIVHNNSAFVASWRGEIKADLVLWSSSLVCPCLNFILYCCWWWEPLACWFIANLPRLMQNLFSQAQQVTNLSSLAQGFAHVLIKCPFTSVSPNQLSLNLHAITSEQNTGSTGCGITRK